MDPRPEEEYFKALTFERQLDYIRHCWGCELAIQLDYISAGPSRCNAVITVSVPNLIHKLELFNPPSICSTFTIGKGSTVSLMMSDALWEWYLGVVRHLHEINDPA